MTLCFGSVNCLFRGQTVPFRVNKQAGGMQASCPWVVQINKQMCPAVRLPASGQSSVEQPWQPLLMQALSQNLSLKVFLHIPGIVWECVCMYLSRHRDYADLLTSSVCVIENWEVFRPNHQLSIKMQ